MASIISQVETSHEDMIHDAQLDYFGSKLATCSSDKTVKIYLLGQNGTQTLVADLRGHEGPVWQLGWGHPSFGNVLASCSYDKKLIVWKEDATGKWNKLYEYAGHDSSVNSLSWAPREFGFMLACGSSDGSVSVISSAGDGIFNSKKILNAHSIGCNAVSWAPAIPPTASLYVPESYTSKTPLVQRLTTAGCDNLVKIWKFSEEEDKWLEEQKLEAHSDWVRDVAWAPSIGLPKSYIASCSQDRRVIIWFSEGGTNNWSFKVLNTFDDVVWHVSWSVMGNILAVSCGDNKVSLWKENLSGEWACISDVQQSKAT